MAGAALPRGAQRHTDRQYGNRLHPFRRSDCQPDPLIFECSYPHRSQAQAFAASMAKEQAIVASCGAYKRSPRNRYFLIARFRLAQNTKATGALEMNSCCSDAAARISRTADHEPDRSHRTADFRLREHDWPRSGSSAVSLPQHRDRINTDRSACLDHLKKIHYHSLIFAELEQHKGLHQSYPTVEY